LNVHKDALFPFFQRDGTEILDRERSPPNNRRSRYKGRILDFKKGTAR